MQRHIIRYLLGKILQVEAFLLFFPLLISFIYQESLQQKLSYLSTILILIIVGFLFSFKKPQRIKILATDGMLTVALGWILLSFFGALPLVFSGEIPHLMNAFFEISSGFTTTGSSILTDLSTLKHSSLFWRSFTHLIGGMGVLVFTLAILPNSGSDSVQLMRAEVPGPIFGKLVSKLSQTARILYGIYIVMTAILVLILLFLKVPLFDALLLAFGTAGTGGFSIHNQGFAIYEQKVLIEWIIGFGMLVFGINFNLYYFILLGHIKDVFKDEEFKTYISIIFGSVAVITAFLYTSQQSFSDLLRKVFFNVVSIMTTTGYATDDFALWPFIAQMILLLLMFIGGSAGSTAGGLKVSRVLVYAKSTLAELKRIEQPKRIVVPKLSGKSISAETQNQIMNYLLVYLAVFIVIFISVAVEMSDFATAFSAVAATFNNIGPGLAHVGPTKNFFYISDWNKLLLSLGMIAGRLELYPILLLFSPRILKKLVLGKVS